VTNEHEIIFAAICLVKTKNQILGPIYNSEVIHQLAGKD